MPKILIEGPDGAGKTTVAKMLAAHFEIPYLKFSQSKSVEEAINMTDQVTYNYQHCIIDRIKAVDHLIYGGIIDRIDFNSVEISRMLNAYEDLRNSSSQFLTVFMYADIDVLWSRLNERGDETYVKKEDLRMIISAYRYYLPPRKNCMHIDSSNKTPEQIFQMIMRWYTHANGFHSTNKQSRFGVRK